MKVYFSHGKESGPQGTKIARLSKVCAALGCEVESIDYTDTLNPEIRAQRLTDVLREEPSPFVLVGSSMGAYVSLLAAERVAQHNIRADGIFLMAPALYMPAYEQQSYVASAKRTEVVHGWSDDVIPIENSIRFSRANNCALHLITGDHGLNSSLESIESIFTPFLKSLLS